MHSTAALPPLPPLSAVLRSGTADAHASAEQSPFFAALAAGRVTEHGLAALLTRLVPVYDALEAVGSGWSADPRVAPLLLPSLPRSARLRADLVHLTGSADAAPTPAAMAYADRIETVGRASAAAFVAHHYTRCLGDLSGGQVIRAALTRSLGVGDGSGASFFCFPQVRPAALKQQYRSCLDAAPFSDAQRDQLVAEALVAYRLNVDLSAELDADLPRWTSPSSAHPGGPAGTSEANGNTAPPALLDRATDR